MDNIIYMLAVNAIPLLTAITLHEAAHGYAARLFGDRTAEMLGRISLNPIKHIDPIGTLLIPTLTMLFGGFFFGWAKPVPVNFNNLRNPKTDMIWVAAAGPASNFLMGAAWALIFHFVDSSAVRAVATAGIAWNIALMVLNLLPLLPLDGGRILAGLLPGPLSYKFSRLEPYGFFVLIGLLLLERNGVPNVFTFVLFPIANALHSLFGA